jgi:hypothetical protein
MQEEEISMTAFNRLPHFEQEELVQAAGKSLFLAREFGEYEIHYFSLYGFAVEIYIYSATGKTARCKAIPAGEVPDTFREN